MTKKWHNCRECERIYKETDLDN